jgi:hypothetical protein
MNIKELRIELIMKEKTAIWLSQKLGYSPAYMYRCVAEGKEKEVKRIEKILSEVK